MMDAKADPSNPVLNELLEELENSGADVYNDAADFLGKVNRQRPEVNLSDISRNAEEGQTVLIPGKLLGSGYLDQDVRVAAFQTSKNAREKVEDQGEFIYIEDLIETNPEGEEVKLLV